MNCVYDLSRYPANFNFVDFLSASVAYGATHVIFSNSKKTLRKYGAAETAERINNILIPCCELMGVSYEFGDGKGIDPGYHMSAPIKAYRETGKLGKFKSAKTGTARFTVTLRNSLRYPARNSPKVFEEFGREIGATIIPDYAQLAMPLVEKVALYAGAEMNYFVANGLGSMCIASDYPYRQFLYGIDEAYHAQHGYPVGSQLPWANENQRFVWKCPTIDDFMEAHGAR